MSESFSLLINEKQDKVTELNKTVNELRSGAEAMDKRIFDFKQKLIQKEYKIMSISAENSKLK
jgi:septal ring factor EnvC (AmiA/AmiB activator)